MRRVWFVVAAVILAVGCSSRGPDLPVNGIVTMDGVPMDGAAVTFYSEQKGGPNGGALTGSDGKFVIIREKGQKGLPAGKYKVTVSKRRGGPVTDEPVVAAVTDADLKDDLPAIYSDPSKTILSYSVTGDGQPIDIKLSSKRKN